MYIYITKIIGYVENFITTLNLQNKLYTKKWHCTHRHRNINNHTWLRRYKEKRFIKKGNDHIMSV